LETGVVAVKPGDGDGRGAEVGEELIPSVRGSVGEHEVVKDSCWRLAGTVGGRELGVVPDGLGEGSVASGFEGGEFEVWCRTKLDQALDLKPGKVGGDV
jgi:hypothetical protein